MVNKTERSSLDNSLSIKQVSPKPTLDIIDDKIENNSLENDCTNIEHELEPTIDNINNRDIVEHCNSSILSDSITDHFIKMQDTHIERSKANKYDYTPLQFAKSLFQKMMAENGVASERKFNLRNNLKQTMLNESFATPDMNEIKHNELSSDYKNPNPILNAFKASNECDYKDDNSNNEENESTKMINKIQTNLFHSNRHNHSLLNHMNHKNMYINGNYLPEFNSEYDSMIDKNMMNTSKLSMHNHSMYIEGQSPKFIPFSNTSPQFFETRVRNDFQYEYEPPLNEHDNTLNEHYQVISASKLLQLDATMNKTLPHKISNVQHPIHDNLTCVSTKNNDNYTNSKENICPSLKNENISNVDNNTSNVTQQIGNDDDEQVDLFKNYAIAGRLLTNNPKTQNSTINKTLLQLAENKNEHTKLLPSNNSSTVKQSHKIPKRNIFKRLFKRLRHKNRFNNDLETNDAITSFNTEYNRSRLNEKTRNKSFTNDSSIVNDNTLMSIPSHSKSVNFAPDVPSYLSSDRSLIEEFDRDQQFYNTLKDKTCIQNKNIPSNDKIVTPNPNITFKKIPNIKLNNTTTKLTFYIGADNIPFKTEIKIEPTRVTLKMIKNVLPKLGKHTKYYFKVNDPHNIDGYFKEISNDYDCVPLYDGQPICKFFSNNF